MTDIRLPNISASADASTQMAQMRSYLYQMVEQLNWALAALDSGGTASLPVQTSSLPVQTVGQDAPATRDETDQRMANLRDIIIKSAESVQMELDAMSSTYVAVSDFGTYLEKTSQEIEEDPTKITRYFKFAADIQADVDKVDADFSAYKTDVQGYIRQGIVDYDGVTPIIGIAIGQDIRTTQTGVETEQGVFDVIDKRSNMSVWTTEKLSFYIGGQEAAYFSNGKLTVAEIATSRITGSGKWDVSFTSGVKYKWIGG